MAGCKAAVRPKTGLVSYAPQQCANMAVSRTLMWHSEYFLWQNCKKTCPSSVRFPLQAVRPYLFKPIVEQFCHMASPALSSGLDSVPRGKTDRSQSGKKVETFAGRDGSA